MKKNQYQQPRTIVVGIAAIHILMVSGEEQTTPNGNVNNTPQGGMIGF